MSETTNCSLCGLSRGIVATSEHWTMALNDNQALLGKVFFALRRHETDTTALSPEEVTDLWAFLARAKNALHTLFQPDHYNYVFLMNMDPHVHFHIFPRYREAREFAGHTFTDPDYGGHYGLDVSKKIDDPLRQALVSALRSALDSQGALP